MELKNKKRVLLFMPSYSKIYHVLIKNLEKMGYEVIYQEEIKFVYQKKSDKINNFFRKTFLKDKEYKNKLRRLYNEKHIVNNFNTRFDYTLIIHPSSYSKKSIEYLKTICNKVIAYHWEGFSRFEVLDEVIESFDVFGVFDRNDFLKCQKSHSNIILTQSFFFDVIPPKQKKEFDLLYVGADLENRYNQLEHIASIAQNKLKTYFKLYSNKTYNKDSELVTNNKIPYETNLILASKSRCQIDMKLKDHNGLSLRFFEALHFSQKIITDNKSVKEFDFYNSNNILIVDDWNKLTYTALYNFLEVPYINIEEKIKRKYSFEYWFNNIIK